MDIPIVDFTPFLEDDSAGKRAVAQAIYQACQQVGFMYLINHGVPQPRIDQAFQQSEQYWRFNPALE